MEHLLLGVAPARDPSPSPHQVLPWSTYSKEHFELARAETILAQDHYGAAQIMARDRIQGLTLTLTLTPPPPLSLTPYP